MAKINQKKYKNAVVFFAKRIQNGTLGKLKMMKLLYYLDFDFFEKYGRSITGDEYLRFANGPVPRMAEKILKEMNGQEIKITSHGEAPWIATKPDEVIDYNLSLYRNKYGEMANV